MADVEGGEDVAGEPETTIEINTIKVWARDTFLEPTSYVIRYTRKRLTYTQESFNIVKGRDKLEALKNFYERIHEHES